MMQLLAALVAGMAGLVGLHLTQRSTQQVAVVHQGGSNSCGDRMLHH